MQQNKVRIGFYNYYNACLFISRNYTPERKKNDFLLVILYKYR